MHAKDRYTLSEHPANANQLAVELYSEHHIDLNVKNHLIEDLTTHTIYPDHAKVLILGGRAGGTAEIILSKVAQIDLVEEEPYATLLEERFVKGRQVDYFHGKEGNIGQHYILPAPNTTDKTVRVIRPEQFHEQALKSYDVILVQNCIVTDKFNLAAELISIEHSKLVTMIVPGRVKDPRLFQFFTVLEKEILMVFYDAVFHQRLQNRRFLTGRRSELIHHEIFVWERKNKSEEDQQKIKETLKKSLDDFSKGPQKAHAEGNPYETKELVDMYLEFHFGEDHLGVPNYPKVCADVCIKQAEASKVQGRALDLGCAVGRTSFELANHFKEVVGLDYSKAFIQAANDTLVHNYKELEGKVRFVVGDACNLDPALGQFDLVFGGNLVDRLPDPAAFLTQVANFVSPKGLLILTSPYSWMSDYTDPKKWIGGIIEQGKPVTTQEGMRRVLTSKGFKQQAPEQNLLFVIRENEWVYQYTTANATYWIKSQ